MKTKKMKPNFATAASITLTAFLIAMLVAIPNAAFASPTFSGPSQVSSQVPTISAAIPVVGHLANPTYPYVGAYVDSGDEFGSASAVRTTVSFPNTPNPSVIGTGNWLAAGMFVKAEDSKVGSQDYGFYSVITLDSSGNLWFNIGEYEDTEFTHWVLIPPLDLLVSGFGETLDFYATYQISGVALSTPITMTMSWGAAGSANAQTVYWSVTINSVTYNLQGASFNAGSVHSGIIRGFYVGKHGFSLPIIGTVYSCYGFQFGVMSLKPITSAGWEVQFMNPQYYESSTNLWYTMGCYSGAYSLEGGGAWYDNTWQWGGQDFSGVSIASFTSGTNCYADFYYGSTEGTGHILWPTTTVVITASDPSDPYLRIWAVTFDKAMPSESSSGYVGANAQGDYYSGNTMTVQWPLSSGSHYLEFIVSQSGGSSYGTYSGTITINGVAYSFSGVTENVPAKINFQVTFVSRVVITASDPSDSYPRYWAVTFDKAMPSESSSGYVGANAQGIYGSGMTMTVQWPLLAGSHYLEFIVSQSGGSAYGTYSGTITINGNSYSFSGVTENVPAKINFYV